MQKLKTDPRLQMPALVAEEYAELESSILKHGCLHPILVWRGYIVDGHHRHSICINHRIAFPISTLDLPDMEAAIYESRRIQLARRNVTPQQRMQYLGEMSEYVRTHRTADMKKGKAAAEVAKAAGVSTNTVERASRYVRAQRKLGLTPEQAKTVDSKAVMAMADALPDDPTANQLHQARDSLMEIGEIANAVPPPEPEPTTAPAAATDSSGHSVPSYVAAAFLSVEMFDSVESAMTILTKRINDLVNKHSDMMRDFPADKWLHGIRKMRSALHNCRPHTVCNYCHGQADVGPGRARCTSCGGRGWQTLSQDSQTPSELRTW